VLGNPEKVPQVLVLDALGRIERSEVFRTSKNLSKILRICVEGTLAEKPPTAAEIAKEILTEYAFKHDPKGGGVRVQAKRLREKLEEYQKGCGAHELVWIDLPDGAYEAKFSYNSNSEVMKHMARAQALKNELVFGEKYDRGAVYEMWKAIEAEPKFRPAYPALVECSCLYVLYEVFLKGFSSPGDSLESAYGLMMNKAQDEIDSCLVLGGIYTLERKWQEASLSFEKAKAIDAVKMGGSLWYGLYLLLMGDFRAAIDISGANLKCYPDRDSVRLCHALFLYLAREGEAFKVLHECVRATREVERASDILTGYMHMYHEVYFAAVELLDSVYEDKDYLGGKWWPHIGALIFCNTKSIDRGHEFLGARGLDEARSNQKVYVERCRSEMEFVDMFQRMFLYMAAGNGEKAITALRSACLKGHPISAALWLWPFLDDYRDHPRFVRLARKLNVPEAQRIASERLIKSNGGRSSL